MKKIKKGGIIILVIIILVALLTVYFTFFYTRTCPDAVCFNNAMVKCKRATYLNDAKDGAWLYKIAGGKDGRCEIHVKLIQLKEGSNEMAVLENKDMTCYLDLGVISSPQEDLVNCHGRLKEEMQGVIITRLHNYIVENLGEISKELETPI